MGILINQLPTDELITNFCIDHKCSCCGSCCAEFLPVTRKEIEVIRKYLEEHKDIKASYGTDSSGETLVAQCCFKDEQTNRCKIYPVRPYVCRHFKCDKNIELLKKEREEYAKRADYNSFDGRNTPVVSFHFLFFGDIKYDLVYRHNVISIANKQFSFNKPISLREEMFIMPLYVDRFVEIDEKKGE